MEKSAIDTIHSLNVLKDLIEYNRPQNEISEAAKRLKMDNMTMKRYATEMIRSVDEYKRVHDDDKISGALRMNAREYDRHDFREIYNHLNMIEDSTFYVDKAAAAAIMGNNEYAAAMIRNITNQASNI